MKPEQNNAEALARVEHKLDHIIRLLSNVLPVEPLVRIPLQINDPTNICPICGKNVVYLIEVESNVVVRRCGCSTGKVPTADLDRFAPPVTAPRRNEYGDTDQEDRSNPNRGRGNQGPKRK